MAVVVATGITVDGGGKVLGLDVGDSEDEVFWRSFLAAVKRRGLTGVRLVISDQHAGLVAALKRSFQGTAHQRCRVHYADVRVMPMLSWIPCGATILRWRGRHQCRARREGCRTVGIARFGCSWGTRAPVYTSDGLPDDMIPGARIVADAYRQATGRPINREALAERLRVPLHIAERLLTALTATEPYHGQIPARLNGNTPVDALAEHTVVAPRVPEPPPARAPLPPIHHPKGCTRMRYRYEPSPEDVAQVRDDLKPFIHDPARYSQELADMLITFGLTLPARPTKPNATSPTSAPASNWSGSPSSCGLATPSSPPSTRSTWRRGAAGLRRPAPATTPCYRSRSRATGTSSSPGGRLNQAD